MSLSLLISVRTQFYLYHTKYPHSHGDYMCLYRYVKEFKGQAHHLIPYCLRTSIAPEIETKLSCYGSNITFVELKRNNISAEKLLEWFTPIDLISDYQEFLLNGTRKKEGICNCSQYSFGPRCHYQFAINTSSFNEL